MHVEGGRHPAARHKMVLCFDKFLSFGHWQIKSSYSYSFQGLNTLGFEVWFGKVCGWHLCFASTFRISTRFLWQKLGCISHYFHDRNPRAFQIRCVLARATWSSPSVCVENIIESCLIFMAKVRQSFKLGAPQGIVRV